MARPGCLNHPKFLTALRKSGASRALVIGSLEIIWMACYETGNPILGDKFMVEAIAEWTGEPGKLFEALLTCGGEGQAGFIEEVPGQKGRYQVHDLFHHAPEYVQRRMEREAARTAKGETISEARRRAAQVRWGANGKQADANDGQLHDANGCKVHANGATPSTQHPAPSTQGRDTCPSESTKPLPEQELFEAWNAVKGFRPCRTITEKRRAALRQRLRDQDWAATWREAVARASRSAFCRGEVTGKEWRADLDWFLKPDTVTKIMEGKYDDRNGHGGNVGSDSRVRTGGYGGLGEQVGAGAAAAS